MIIAFLFGEVNDFQTNMTNIAKSKGIKITFMEVLSLHLKLTHGSKESVNQQEVSEKNK